MIERFVALYRIGSSVGAVVALIVANAIPLVGVLFLGWNVWTILIVYWLENGIIGAFNVAKIAKAEGPEGFGSGSFTVNGRAASSLTRFALVPFFIMHYGLFWAVHGVFVFTMPLFASMGTEVSMADGVSVPAIILAVIALTISHGISFWFNYLGRREYLRTAPSAQMFAPYGRLIVLHITIIVGAMAIATTGAPAALVAILVILKIGMDLGFHLAEHRKKAAAVSSSGSTDRPGRPGSVPHATPPAALRGPDPRPPGSGPPTAPR